MPIYAYKCGQCGHEKDVLQKISDAPLTECPACGAQSFAKQVTAAGFQLKGSGWYVTDFRDGGKKNASAKKEDTSNAKDAGTDSSAASAPSAGDSVTASSESASSSPTATDSKPAAPTPAADK